MYKIIAVNFFYGEYMINLYRIDSYSCLEVRGEDVVGSYEHEK